MLFFLSASQMWCLGRFLPLLIGDKIPKDSDHWRNFLLLLDIVDCVFAPVCDGYVVADLRSQIEAHHLEFKRLYPEHTIIPKMHYMVHYPEMIMRYVVSLHPSFHITNTITIPYGCTNEASTQKTYIC